MSSIRKTLPDSSKCNEHREARLWPLARKSAAGSEWETGSNRDRAKPSRLNPERSCSAVRRMLTKIKSILASSTLKNAELDQQHKGANDGN